MDGQFSPGQTSPQRQNGQGTSHRPDAADEDIDLARTLGVLWAGKLRIALCMALGLAGAAFIFANTMPTFRADALLQLEEKGGASAMALPSGLSNLIESNPRSVTEIEIMRSGMILSQAVANLNLDWRVTPDYAPLIGTMVARYPLPYVSDLLPSRYARPRESLTLTELVVPPAWLNQDLGINLGAEGRYTLALPDERVLDGLIGTALSLPDEGFTLTIGSTTAPAGRNYTIRQMNETQAINGLRNRLTVTERGRGSGILEVSVIGESSNQNVRALDAILNAYQRQNVARSSAQAESSLAFIRDQIPQAERNLREAESALNAFRLEQASIDLSQETNTLLGQITRIEAELFEMQRREDELAQRFTQSHPTYRLFLEERRRLEDLLADLRSQVGDLPETQRQIVNLTRDVELAQRLHLELLTRAQEVEVLRASTIGNVRIIDNARPLGNPIAPGRNRLLILGALIGLLGGAGLVLLRDWSRKGVQDASELERLGLPVFATINYSRGADTQNKRKGQLPILALERPDDITVEAFRSLRTSLHFGMLDAKSPILTVTSAHPEAGKSFVATNLAVIAAQAGQRVCLIDADLRRGQLRRFFGLPRNQPGLPEILAGDGTLNDLLIAGPVDGLSVLVTGRYPPNPSEMLMRAQLRQLIDQCAARFDLTIIDAPPALAVTDPVILARSSGATICVARHDTTTLNEIEATMKSFATAGLRLNGAVLNGFDPRKSRARYGYGYSYRYAYKQRKD
ncbi:MAG TPA: polysaccharide biosynthesis tyrosine autokinase [Paracoccaceae bacterium]|nr:polysaccharide biosynthesis tyrosine autokinase [Paracoccaceae bacterium]HMO71078.1 polysaccharide biosynthesis tyrosine autokinase [Paracoccaceae bacterium]